MKTELNFVEYRRSVFRDETQIYRIKRIRENEHKLQLSRFG
jgi:hypothetical protein